MNTCLVGVRPEALWPAWAVRPPEGSVAGLRGDVPFAAMPRLPGAAPGAVPTGGYT